MFLCAGLASEYTFPVVIVDRRGSQRKLQMVDYNKFVGRFV